MQGRVRVTCQSVPACSWRRVEVAGGVRQEAARARVAKCCAAKLPDVLPHRLLAVLETTRTAAAFWGPFSGPQKGPTSVNPNCWGSHFWGLIFVRKMDAKLAPPLQCQGAWAAMLLQPLVSRRSDVFSHVQLRKRCIADPPSAGALDAPARCGDRRALQTLPWSDTASHPFMHIRAPSLSPADRCVAATEGGPCAYEKLDMLNGREKTHAPRVTGTVTHDICCNMTRMRCFFPACCPSQRLHRRRTNIPRHPCLPSSSPCSEVLACIADTACPRTRVGARAD